MLRRVISTKPKSIHLMSRNLSTPSKIKIVTRAQVEEFIEKNQEAKKKQAETLPYTLIDVRELDEVAQTGIIPTSINIPLGILMHMIKSESQEGIAELKDEAVVVYCRSGRRSEEAAKTLVSVGFTDVSNYQGSANEWFKE